ncbi:hypothetical protein POM88_025137 [Heracleum sosnowskyi]|uniref:Uncharacterized protein n=1 Tax=Heracleum sosnowskyi TaxID=360622 RepID=A0AAD8MNK1_9APIA|nr:hypothetical protein POM88_025137 [Heracleum sosnowskyi]
MDKSSDVIKSKQDQGQHLHNENGISNGVDGIPVALSCDITTPHRSSRLRELSLPKISITEPTDLVQSEEEVMQSEEFMEEGYESHEEQKQWVKDNGFKQLLEFDLELLPGPFAYNVLKIFEHNSVPLRLSNGEINITEEDVSDVLGLPKGGDSIMLGSIDKYNERIAYWNSQFLNPNQITTIQILQFDDNLDSLVDYNWPEYLLNSLVAAFESWNRSTSLFFNGSLIFLTLLYVDRVRHKGIKLVERMTPSCKGWTEEKLRKKQAIELYNGKFGVGSILPPLRDVLASNKKNSKKSDVDENAQDWNAYEGNGQDWNDYEHHYDNATAQANMQSPEKNGAGGSDYHQNQEWDAWETLHRQNITTSDAMEKDSQNEENEEETEMVS